MRLTSMQQLEDLGVVNYIGLHVWTLALRGIYHEANLIYLLDSGNILNMFEIQKCWNKISQKDRYLHSKIHCLALDLLCTTVLGTIFFLVCFFLEISSLFSFFWGALRIHTCVCI